jgi:hypothetical protein
VGEEAVVLVVVVRLVVVAAVEAAAAAPAAAKAAVVAARHVNPKISPVVRILPAPWGLPGGMRLPFLLSLRFLRLLTSLCPSHFRFLLEVVVYLARSVVRQNRVSFVRFLEGHCCPWKQSLVRMDTPRDLVDFQMYK